MKKATALLLILFLCLSTACGYASQIPDFGSALPNEGEHSQQPAASAVTEAALINVHGQSVRLDFDPTPQFSYIKDGLVQSSFYAFGPEGKYLYELYLIFPETVIAGSVFTQDLALQGNLEEAGVVLLISSDNMEDLYAAGQYGNAIYPEGTSYTIRFDNVSDTSAGKLFSGTVSATLSGEDKNRMPIDEKITLTNAPFSFTMPVDGTIPRQPSDGTTPTPDTSPMPYATPAPVSTPRSDMYRI